MATTDTGGVEEWSGTRLTLDLWHPNCWAIEATSQTDGGVLAHAIYNTPKADGDTPNSVNGLFTAFADTNEEVEELLDAIRASDRGGPPRTARAVRTRPGRPGNVVREFFLEYDPADMMCPTLLEHGFVHSAPVRIEGGREEWQGVFRRRAHGDSGVARRGPGERGRGGDRAVDVVVGAAGTDPREQRLDTLTTTQREVYEHAREAGVLRVPRGRPPAIWPTISTCRRRRCSNTSGRRSRSCLIREARQPESGAGRCGHGGERRRRVGVARWLIGCL